MTITIPTESVVTPLYKKQFLDWHFNNDQIYSDSGSTAEIWVGMSWNDPTNWENELTNTQNDNREWWFRTWDRYIDGPGVSGRRPHYNYSGFDYGTNSVFSEQFPQIGSIRGDLWPSLTSFYYDGHWLPQFSGYFSVDNAGNTSPNNVYAAPSHILYFNSGFLPTSQSQYDDQLLAAVPIVNHLYDPSEQTWPNWISEEIYFDRSSTEVNQWDVPNWDRFKLSPSYIIWRPEDY